MSAQASAPRATLDLKVRVWGMGSNNQPFFQNAMAQNISATGACIYGIEVDLKVGDVIGVQYETRKARCKVVWVVDAGALKKTQVGVQLVADQECPWTAALPLDMKVEERTQPRHDNRRMFLRHRISYPLELRDERVNTPLRVTTRGWLSGSPPAKSMPETDRAGSCSIGRPRPGRLSTLTSPPCSCTIP